MEDATRDETNALFVIQEMENTTAQYSQHPEFSSFKFRQTLNRSIINIFTDLNKVAGESQNSSSLATFMKFIQCFRHCLEEFPQIFISSGSAKPANNDIKISSKSDVSSCKRTDDALVALAFTEWLIMRLLRVLSEPCVSILHEKCEDLLVSLLQVVRMRNPVNFRHLLTCFTCLLSDLNVFNEKLYDCNGYCGNEELIIERYFSSTPCTEIKEAKELNLTDIPIRVSSPSECEHLQMKLTILLKKLIPDLIQFLPDKCDNFWKLLCLQIELGDLNLKKESLQTITCVLKERGLPSSELLTNHLLDCLQAIINILCSGQMPAVSECSLFEVSVASCLEAVTHQVVNSEITFSASVGMVNHSVRNIMQVVSIHGLLNVKCAELQTTIVMGLLKFISFLKDQGCIIPWGLVLPTSKTLITNFGSFTDHKFLVPIFVSFIDLEQSKNVTETKNDEFNHPIKLRKCISGPTILSTAFDSFGKLKLNTENSLLPLKERFSLHLQLKQLEVWSLVFQCLQTLLRNSEVYFSEWTKACIMTNTVSASVKILLLSSVKSLCPLAPCLYLLKWPMKGIGVEKSCLFSDTLVLLKTHVTKLVTTPAVFRAETFDELVFLAIILVCVQETLHCSDEMYEELCCVFSVPWLNGADENFYDLTSKLPLPKYVSHWQGLTSEKCKTLCLQGLSLLPQHIAPKWRLKTIKLCLVTEDTAIRSAAVKVLPMYFHTFGSVDEDIGEVLNIISEEQDVTVLLDLCNAVGRINCALSGSCEKARQVEDNGCPELVPKLICCICDQVEIKMQDISMTFHCILLLENFLKRMVNHRNVEIRRAVFSSIPSYFAHSKTLSETLLHSLTELVDDSDSKVRINFRKALHHLFKPPGREQTLSCKNKMSSIIMPKLKSSLVAAKSKNNVRLQETILQTVGELGKVAENDYLLIIIICLLKSLLSENPLVLAVVRNQLKDIAQTRNMRMYDLFRMFSEPICKFLAESIQTLHPKGINKQLHILEEVQSVFGFCDIKSLLNSAQRFVVPYLVCKTTAHTSDVLKFLSKCLKTHKRDLLLNNFSFIFSHLVRNSEKIELEKALTYVQGEAELEFGSLLRCNYQHIHNELLMHIGSHYDQVFAGLATLALKNQEKNHVIKEREDMADYLKPKLLGFLVFFDSHLLKNSVTLDDKKMALESLISIIELMDQRHITSVRFKIMATLRIALRFKEGNFPMICCKAWKTFVYSVDVTSLGSILNQVIVALLPMLELEPSAVADIFKFLIIENKSNLKEYFHDLYFIPDIPELQEIHTILREFVEDPCSQSDFHSLLSHSLKGVSHENLDVRLHALAKLKQILNANQLAIHEHLLSRESADHLISHLVSVFMSACKEPDPRAKISLGECLGELGAIDPGRLEIKTACSMKALDNFCAGVDEENFSYSLIQELVHSFLAAGDCRIQDCSAFAIQEALRIYKCSGDQHTSKTGRNLWNRFPPDIQEILSVLLHSQYKPLEKMKDKFPRPIYGSKLGSNFKDWVTNWYFDLLHKVKHETAAKVFHSCSMIIKYDLNCALFLLPYIVVYALLNGHGSEREEVFDELIAVLNHQERSQPSQVSDLCHLSCQTIFSVFDHLTKWVRHRQQCIITDAHNKMISIMLSNDKEYTIMKNFISKVPQILLAKTSFHCQAYTRALLHLEQHIKKNPAELNNNITFLQKIYAALDDPDGVAGVAVIRKEEPTLKYLILEHEAIGQMQDAFACYEKAVKIYPKEVSYYCGLLKCFMGMDQQTAALTYANGLLKDQPEWKDDLNSFRVEASWKLANWETLELFLDCESASDKWNVGLGKILFSASKGNMQEFKEQIEIVRNNQMAPLSAAAMENGAYLRGYEYLTRLHMLTDLEKSVSTFFEINCCSSHENTEACDTKKVLSEWKYRKQLVQSSLRYQEPILNLHRVLLQMGKERHPELAAKFSHEIAHCWLQSAKLARKNGHQQRSYSCLLEAGALDTPALFMEKTKWHWNKGEKEQAISSLHKGIQEHFPNLLRDIRIDKLSSTDQHICAKAKLLLAIYSEESAITDSNSLLQMYRDVVTLQPRWEESHFHLGKYYDKMLNTIEKQESMSDTRAEIVVHIVKNLGSSLKYGSKHIYHSLPRLLHLWFDMGTEVVEQSRAKKQPSTFKQLEANLSQLNTIIIPELFEKLPLFLFLTAFPQMVSRICHSHPDITLHLQQIIAKLLTAYTQQSMWMMMAVSKSSYPTRVQRCKEIFHTAIKMKPDLSKFIQDTTKLADKFIELSNKTVLDSPVLSISHQFPILPKLIGDRQFSQVMLPLQSQMIVTLPMSSSGSNVFHNPFPQIPVYIQSFQDTVEIFQSLQKPKKITIRGTDGKLYGMICKPKDDLRKDCRLMEFNNLMNRYLKSDPEARKRQLYIRTYAVVPLNEECGIIEFVPNLSGYLNVLNRLYKYKGMQVTRVEIRAMMPPKTATNEQKLDIFESKVLPRFPPVFSEWFLRTFPDPTAWYIARLAYARTTAVMSMVGYIVGLGDRHGENILFDSSCGDTVHVDLNCLFNKGERMECPEVVPFRLTHNMIDAMGPTGYEGVFRKACEVTMRVMRNQTDALMSVLRPFVHDPLVEWSRTSKHSRTQPRATGEIRNEMGLIHVKDIEQRLNGLIRAKNKPQYLPLSIEGQVNYLIKEASDNRNLSQMYIGWTAYM